MTAQNSDTMPAGNVISQNPMGGASVVPGSAVDLMVSTGPAAATDTLTCKEAAYKAETDEFEVEVKSTDESGGRTMNARMDVDGDGSFERSLGTMVFNSDGDDTYLGQITAFADPNPAATSVIRVSSDLGGVCEIPVKID